jgi:hypothetical protein
VAEGEKVGDAGGCYLAEEIAAGGRSQLAVLIELQVPYWFTGAR